MTAKITGVWNKPEATGDYLAELLMPDGTITTASISPEVAQAAVSVLQPAVLERAIKLAQNMKLPSVEVNGLSVVHQGPRAELGVATDQTGQLVFQMSDEWLNEARRIIDLVLASRQSSKIIQ